MDGPAGQATLPVLRTVSRTVVLPVTGTTTVRPVGRPAVSTADATGIRQETVVPNSGPVSLRRR